MEDLKQSHLLSVMTTLLDEYSLVDHQIESFNSFIDMLPDNITNNFDIYRDFPNKRTDTPEDRDHKTTALRIHWRNVTIHKPRNPNAVGIKIPILPNEAKMTSSVYSGDIEMEAVIELVGKFNNGLESKLEIEKKTFKLTEMPIMVGSKACNTYNMPKDFLKNCKEDPTDIGGYYVISNKIVLSALENIVFNRLITSRPNESNIHVKGDFISQPQLSGNANETSSQIKIFYMTNGLLMIEINSTKFVKVKLPFYIVFGLLGMFSKKEMVKTIIPDMDNDSIITKKIINILNKAFEVEEKKQKDKPMFTPLKNTTDQRQLVDVLSKLLVHYMPNIKNKDGNNVSKYVNWDLLEIIDKIIFPHIGTSPNDRIQKCWYLGSLIYKVLLVHLGVAEVTDRDHLKNKRIYSAGIMMLKAFTTHFNEAFVKPLIKDIKKIIENKTFKNIIKQDIGNTFDTILAKAQGDLSRAMEQSIGASQKFIVIRQKVIQNKFQAKALEQKSELNTLCELRSIIPQGTNDSSNQTERANRLRRYHPSYDCLICSANSADTGAMVGKKKQIALFALITTAGNAFSMYEKLLEDESLIKINGLTTNEICNLQLQGYAKIFINGKWLGFTTCGSTFRDKYIELRRKGIIVEPKTSICWDIVFNEVHFQLDAGRLIHPAFIVKSNLNEYIEGLKSGKPVEFKQDILLTMDYMRKIQTGEKNFHDLIADGIMEFLGAEEKENTRVAINIDMLRHHKSDVCNQFTHCMVDQAIFGIAAMTSPFGNHTQPVRLTYQTNQGKQSDGWPYLNHPYYMEKNRAIQYYNQMPLIKTISHKFVRPNGMNVMVLMASFGGDNQEDSMIMNKAAIDRGLFDIAYYKYEKLELEQGDVVRKPTSDIAQDMKTDCNYDLLEDNGLIKKGSLVKQGDVLVGRLKKKPKKDNGKEFIDNSLIYKNDEPCIIDDVKVVISPKTGTQLVFVKQRYDRAPRTGDKMSSRSGNKCILACAKPQSEMPYTYDGTVIDMVLNPHCIPSRMTIGQLYESLLSVICTQNGIIMDGTPFTPLDIDDLMAGIVKLGFRANGKHTLYNPITGEPFGVAMSFGHNFIQRLSKNVLDNAYVSSGSCPSDAITHQPISGKSNGGGLRFGYMEFWCTHSHGSEMTLYEKAYEHSDGIKDYICRGCGYRAIYNEKHGLYSCSVCKSEADISAIDSRKTAVVLNQELSAMGMKVQYGLKPREYLSSQQ